MSCRVSIELCVAELVCAVARSLSAGAAKLAVCYLHGMGVGECIVLACARADFCCSRVSASLVSRVRV